ncbi:hypothetical protein ABGN05_05605 [Aquibium sp. LZ166]|uniref:Uncharacterized protein n=1 Tax=Aquibium pacificus TaxID=3153579 RepID=A0ABV3SEE5_9HYPH
MSANSFDVRNAFAHLLIITIELLLLFVQYQRAEIFAFDVLPEFADVQFLFLYGSHYVGILWVVLVILFTYVFWELVLKLQEPKILGKGRLILYAAMIVGLFNALVVVGEFIFFSKLIDSGNTSSLDTVLALIIGAIGVGAHQITSLWIMKHVIRNFWLPKESAT